MIRDVHLSDAKAITDIYNVYVTQSTATFEDRVGHNGRDAPVGWKKSRRRIPILCMKRRGTSLAIATRIRGGSGQPIGIRGKRRFTLAPGRERHGLGRLLMEHLIAACRDAHDCHALIACITAENAPSIRLHERLGFRQVSRFEQVGRKQGRWLDVVDYELLL